MTQYHPQLRAEHKPHSATQYNNLELGNHRLWVFSCPYLEVEGEEDGMADTRTVMADRLEDMEEEGQVSVVDLVAD